VVCEHQTAQKPQQENICCQLSKLGGTIYECSDVTFDNGFNFFVPNSVLSELRRQLVAALNGESLNGDGSRCVMPMTQENRPQSAPPHSYAFPYLYNIANQQARAFYHADDLTAYELRGGDGPLMQCRHCLRYALGRCRKNLGGQTAEHSTGEWREPLFLRLGDGRLFRLEFDCKNCQMNVYAGFALNNK
jgi:putative protease